MAYLGNPAVDRFTASKTATQFSGNGSAVDFTLDHSVGSPEDILVSVDGVVQEPTVAYGIVSGTTLRFTAAPSSNAGNNIFVYYLFSTLGTVTHPATSALSATSGTFTGNIVIPNAGNIGSASDADAMAISSGGVVTFSQKPVFSSGGGGSMELLSTQTASNSTGIIFDSSLITDTYNNYFIIGHNMSPATDTACPELYMSIDDGANYNLSVGTGRAYLRLQGAGSGHEHENTTDSSIQMGNSQSNLAAEAQSFFGYLQNLRSAAEHKHAHGTYSGAHSAANDAYSWRFGARVISTSKINNVKFDFHTGNFDGVISLYGIRG